MPETSRSYIVIVDKSKGWRDMIGEMINTTFPDSEIKAFESYDMMEKHMHIGSMKLIIGDSCAQSGFDFINFMRITERLNVPLVILSSSEEIAGEMAEEISKKGYKMTALHKKGGLEGEALIKTIKTVVAAALLKKSGIEQQEKSPFSN